MRVILRTYKKGKPIPAAAAAAAATLLRLTRTCEKQGAAVTLEMDKVKFREMGMTCLTWEFHRTAKGKLVYAL